MRGIRSITVVTALALALAAGGAAAQAVSADDAGEAPGAGWMSFGEIAAKIEAQGYGLRSMEIDDGAYEVTAVDASGSRVEADLDPTTGDPLRGWREDR